MTLPWRARRPDLPTLVSVLTVGACVALVARRLDPSLVLSNTTPTGGDTGAHVWAPAYLRDHLLPHGRVSGWSPDWWGGFPALTFYFPLPSLVVVLLDVVIPYNVAFKLVTVAGPVSLPVAAFAFGRLAGIRFPGPALMAVATLPFLFDSTCPICGGNVASMLAGEFSFAFGLSLALLFLGVLARGLDRGGARATAAVLLALTGLSHVVPTLFALAGAAVLVLLRPQRRRLVHVVAVCAAGGALVAFWWLPFVVRLPFLNDLGWTKLTDYGSELFPERLLWLMPLALGGAVAAIGLRLRAGLLVLGLAVVCGLVFVLIPEGRLWNARLVPLWLLCLYLLAAIGLAEAARAAGALGARRRPRLAAAFVPATPVVAIAAVVVVLGRPIELVPAGVPVPSRIAASVVPHWVQWNYSGYEKKPWYGEYRALLRTMSRLPCGRALWEYDGPFLGRYGTPMALMLLPYWTDGCIGSMEGLYFESSATVPFHFLVQSELSAAPSRPQRDLPYRPLDVAEGVRHLQLLGVRYYMTFSAAAIGQARDVEALRPVAVSPPWRIYEVAGSELVEPLAHEPVVVTGVGDRQASWLSIAVPAFQRSAPWDVPLARDGPMEWARIGSDDQPPSRRLPRVTVSRIRAGRDRLSFDVDRPGQPVLVKVSYFPNWRADGARGPWRVTPNLMVVIPTRRHVELRYGATAVEWMGWAVSILGVIGTIGLARGRRRTEASR
jgi:hypothetical protein